MLNHISFKVFLNMIQIRFHKFVGSKCGALLKEAMKKGIAHKKVKQPPMA